MRTNPTEPDPNNPSDAAHSRSESLARVRGASRDERWFRSLVQYSSDVVMILEAHGTVRYVSPAVERVLGYRPEDFVGTLAFDYVHPEDIEYMSKSFAETLEKPGVQPPIEYRVRTADGSWRHMEAVRSNRLDDPHIVGVVANVRDVTERKMADEALKESEERYRAVVAQSVEAIYLFDAETKRVLESNAAFRRLMGYAEEDLLGMRIYDFIAHDEDDIDRNVRRSLKEKRRHIGERRYRRKDGSVIVVDTSASVVSYRGRTALCAVSRDVTERREAEEAVRKSETRLAEAQRLAHLGGWEWDVESDEIFWSDEVYRIYGLAPQEFVPSFERFMEVVHPDDRGLLSKAIDEALHGNEPYDVEHRVVRPDGEVRMVHRWAEVVRGEEGEPLRMVGTVHDVTGRKEAEEALKESEGRFRALTQNSSDVITLLKADGAVAYQSLAIQRILGYSSEELIGENVFGYVHPEDVERVRTAFAEGVEDPGIRPSVEYRFLRKDGSWAWLESVGTNLIEDPGVGAFVVNSRDVTERKEAERLLREAEERYRTVVEAQTELVCRFLPDLTLTFVNDAYCRYFGAKPDELLGSNFMAHIPPENHRYYGDQLSGLRQENPTRTVEHRAFTPGGEIRWLQWTDTAVFDGEGRIVEYQSVGRDVTERKVLEDRLSSTLAI